MSRNRPTIKIHHRTIFRATSASNGAHAPGSRESALNKLTNPSNNEDSPLADQLTTLVVLLDTAVDRTHPCYNAKDPNTWFTFERPIGVIELTAPLSHLKERRPEMFSTDAHTARLPKKGTFVCEMDNQIVYYPASFIRDEEHAERYDEMHHLSLPVYCKFYHIAECDIQIDDRTFDTRAIPSHFLRPNQVKRRRNGAPVRIPFIVTDDPEEDSNE